MFMIVLMVKLDISIMLIVVNMVLMIVIWVISVGWLMFFSRLLLIFLIMVSGFRISVSCVVCMVLVY